MSTGRYYAPGDWNAICDGCGFAYKASLLRRDWQGLMMCAADWNPRQPQDFVRATIDKQTPPWTRTRPAPIFGLAEFITEDSETDFIAPNPFTTEDGLQPFIMES